MGRVKVSVIVPVYNVEQYLDRCLKSLVRQTLQEIEILVVNDGFPDGSQRIIDRYVKQYPQKVFKRTVDWAMQEILALHVHRANTSGLWIPMTG